MGGRWRSSRAAPPPPPKPRAGSRSISRSPTRRPRPRRWRCWSARAADSSNPDTRGLLYAGPQPNRLRMFLIGAVQLAFLLASAPQQPVADDPAPTVRRLAATARLAAQEYRVGIVDGRIVAPGEVEEAKLFLAEARRSAGLLPRTESRPAVAAIDSVGALIAAVAPPDSLDARVERL